MEVFEKIENLCKLARLNPETKSEYLIKINLLSFPNSLNPDKIIFKILCYFNISKKAVLGKSRYGDVLKARQFIHFFLKNLTELSFSKIGEKTNNDHSTVINSCRKITNDMRYFDTKFHYQKINKLLQETM
ncbi:MAG: hypothetical protein GY849_02630 [Deltaproteobacteria bacterium]|nr:hypothetical protein [Deltaproteobacteria bacterium]